MTKDEAIKEADRRNAALKEPRWKAHPVTESLWTVVPIPPAPPRRSSGVSGASFSRSAV